MIKSIYVSAQQVQGVERSGANHLIVSDRGLTKESWEKLQRLGMKLAVATNALDKDEKVCILDPLVQQRFLDRLDVVLQFSPEEIWIDRFRFGGDCTDINNEDAQKAHQPCQYCQGQDRVSALISFGQQIIKYVNGRSKLGLFVVAFKEDQASELSKALGLDYQKLGEIFDMFSPMLYHRMIKRPVSYISEYVEYLAKLTGKEVLPIIQIKDMPDDLEDKMSEAEIEAAFKEAIKPPSMGVCFFWWQHALEKNKTGIISGLLASP